MNKRKVISFKQMPVRMPVSHVLFWLLLIRVYHIPQWFLGIGWLVIGLVWLVFIVATFTEEKLETISYVAKCEYPIHDRIVVIQMLLSKTKPPKSKGQED